MCSKFIKLRRELGGWIWLAADRIEAIKVADKVTSVDGHRVLDTPEQILALIDDGPQVDMADFVTLRMVRAALEAEFSLRRPGNDYAYRMRAAIAAALAARIPS